MKILLDTSFLISALKYKLRWDEELKGHQLYVLDNILDELEKLKKRKKEINLILRLLKRNKVNTLKAKKPNADDALVAEKNYAIATQDKELKQRLKGKKIITIRQKKYIIGL